MSSKFVIFDDFHVKVCYCSDCMKGVGSLSAENVKIDYTTRIFLQFGKLNKIQKFYMHEILIIIVLCWIKI